MNSAVDRRFPRKNADKAARINAHNEEVLEKGRAEMEGLPGSWPAQEPEQTVPVQERPREKSGSLGKLFKRKPVAEQGMAAR